MTSPRQTIDGGRITVGPLVFERATYPVGTTDIDIEITHPDYSGYSALPRTNEMYVTLTRDEWDAVVDFINDRLIEGDCPCSCHVAGPRWGTEDADPGCTCECEERR